MVAGIPADRPVVVVAVNDAARKARLAARTLVLPAAEVLGGRGGGKDDIAQGGGAPLRTEAPAVIGNAFAAVRAVVGNTMGPGGVA